MNPMKRFTLAILILFGFQFANANPDLISEFDFEVTEEVYEEPTTGAVKTVNLPEGQDQFVKFVVNIRAGDSVRFRNFDSDLHSVTSASALSSTYYKDLDASLAMRSDSGAPGSISIKFNRTGTFVYYSKYQAEIGENGQPVAIDGSNRAMMGVIVIR